MAALQDVGLSPEQAAVLLSVILAASVLNRFTHISGAAGFLVNAAALLLGAEIAEVLTAGLMLPFDHVIERTLLVAFAGMLFAAVVMLVVVSPPRQD